MRKLFIPSLFLLALTFASQGWGQVQMDRIAPKGVTIDPKSTGVTPLTFNNPPAVPAGTQNLCILLCNNTQYVGATGAAGSNQWFWSLNFHNTSVLGTGNGVMTGIQIQTDSDSIDTATGMSIANNGKSDALYIGLNGKSGATASSPSGVAIDINRNASSENSSANSGIGLNMFDYSSTNQGAAGPKGIYYQKVNNLNSDHLPIHLRTNNQGLLIETPEGGGYDGTKNVITVQNDVPLQKFRVTANGDAFFANTRKVDWVATSGNDANCQMNGSNQLFCIVGLNGYQLVKNDGSTVYFNLDSNGNVTVGNGSMTIGAATPTGTGSNLGIGNTTGFGNGAAGTAVTTTTKNTGSGPTTPQTIVKYLEIDLGGTKYWVPLVQ